MSSNQAHKVTPPLVGLGHLRVAHGYTLDDVVEGVRVITGRKYTVGAISAVEGGLRRPSQSLLDALLDFYELTGKPHVHPQPRVVPSPSRSAA
jgi:transcriptional regulator with XRE-family HTH domain